MTILLLGLNACDGGSTAENNTETNNTGATDTNTSTSTSGNTTGTSTGTSTSENTTGTSTGTSTSGNSTGTSTGTSTSENTTGTSTGTSTSGNTTGTSTGTSTSGNTTGTSTGTSSTSTDTTKPVFTVNTKVSVDENQKSVLTLTATDNNPIAYRIDGGDSDVLSLLPRTGTIEFDTAPNYEKKKFYTFTAYASDGINESNQTVEINITDIDELLISLAVYNTNQTTSPKDDTLRLYFSEAIDTTTRSNASPVNYSIHGTGDFTDSAGTYNATYKEDKISLASYALQALVPNDTTISINSGSILPSRTYIELDLMKATLISTYAVKATEQDTPYNSDATKNTDNTQRDDGYYQKGIKSQYRKDQIKDVVLDLITGLMWADDENTSTIKRPWITQTVYDNGSYYNTHGETAINFCSNLTLGSYTDWRLPNIHELQSLIHFNKAQQGSIDDTFEHINITLPYWTISSTKIVTNRAWNVDFSIGKTSYSRKDKLGLVRCVRGEQLAAY